MQLYKAKELKSNMVIKEMGGKTMKAMLVFAFCIEYIKDKVLERLCQAIHGLDEDDVHWVLTVPAIWNDQARQFMIAASEKAGIGKDNLTLALEPEGAAMFCKYLAVDKKVHGDETELKAFDENARFMVVDLGGGTIDITVSEVLATGQLREIYNATGGPWGGNYINDQIIKTLRDAIGWTVMERFKAEDFDDYLELLKNVEQRKRGVKYDSILSLKISDNLLRKVEIPFSYKNYVRKEKKSIILSATLMNKIFSSSVDSMMKHVEGLLQKEETRGVSTILLVGGYAASDFVQRAFRKRFEKDFRITFPLHPDMIVLKGAVITGHLVEAIIGRMTKYHYGLGLSTAAVSGRSISVGDSEEKRSFFSLIKKGQKIKVGDVVTQYEVRLKAKSQWANLEVYTTEDDDPKTVIDEEHFTKVGSINVKLPQFKKESILVLTISYDETEFKNLLKQHVTVGASESVTDLGGTIDITVSEVLATGQLREIYNATGGPWGGNYINNQIIKTLKEVIRWSVMGKFKSDNFDEYLELLRDVEQRKRSIKYNSEFSLKISKDLQKKIEIPDSHKKDVQKEKKSIKLSASLMKKIFSSSVDSIMKYIEWLLEKTETHGVSTILLVGGYAPSDFVQRAFREKFHKKHNIIFPLTPDMIVLKGAKGQKIKVGDVVTEYEVVLKAKSKWANLEAYITEDDEPRNVIDEEHFIKVGSINVKLPKFKKESILVLTISYDKTKFKVVATDRDTGRCFVDNCRFLDKEINLKSD
ncbi:unnamed protein product [Mytilus coruscus]|uniref:HSPA12A n=1 Tax=Mytilus coruscus TaxID=42192 RepID=A0A6J8AAV9_MYTCO|nr:unnamed protein product [Mytilus coruscus]